MRHENVASTPLRRHYDVMCPLGHESHSVISNNNLRLEQALIRRHMHISVVKSNPSIVTPAISGSDSSLEPTLGSLACGRYINFV